MTNSAGLITDRTSAKFKTDGAPIGIWHFCCYIDLAVIEVN